MDTKRCLFTTKAENLDQLRKVDTSFQILPLVYFSLDAWKTDPIACLSSVKDELPPDTNVIVRSSAHGEDSEETSFAGAFLSISDVPIQDESALTTAITRVFDSYGSTSAQHQVLIQPMLSDIRHAGVLFTRTLEAAPYYVVNYSNDTHSITDGSSEEHQTYVRWRGSSSTFPEPWLQTLIQEAAKLESLFDTMSLDIEFAVDHAGELFLLQVRPLCTGLSPRVTDDWLESTIVKIQKKVTKLNLEHPDLAGDGTIFGLMPDWNPAEIIGVKPKPLALSLYRELVTDSIWAHQRHNYGYRDLRSFPLLVSFLGNPYIDVRVSFNSFIPDDLSDELATKLSNHYLEQLRHEPAYHDKVEFQILFTCAYPGYTQHLKRLTQHDFTDNEIDRLKFSLLQVTNEMPKKLHHDLSLIDQLEKRRKTVLDSEMSLVQKIYWLVEDCKRYGTLPFAGLARAGFVAKQLLDSFVELGILETSESASYMRSLKTISGEFSRDIALFHQGELTLEFINEKYGHLRPGTYDILSARYDQDNQHYLGHQPAQPSVKEHEEHHFSPAQQAAITDTLREHGINLTFETAEAFIRQAIESREFAKFIFTKSLSDTLELISELGVRVNLSKEDMSYVEIDSILKLYSHLSHDDLNAYFQRNITANRRAHKITQSIRLPPLICSSEDIEHFFIPSTQPNFITLEQAAGQVVAEQFLREQDLKDKIIAIQSADPGWDWLFARGIAGLITEFGGANSHMAIRSAELGIPAVIGCGQVNFEQWKRAKSLTIDCANQTVTPSYS